jgi:polyhydroxybutyrate depolymerase
MKSLFVLRLWLLSLGMLLSAVVQATPLGPGDYRFELQSDGRLRSYLMHVPPQAASGPLPLVISLHGGGGNAELQRHSTGMDGAADRDGYVVVYPNGSGPRGERLLTWSVGNCCGYAQRAGIDDVAFIARLIDDVERRAAIDAGRVYVAGHSNGGMLAHRVGEMLADRVAAVASVAGVHVPGPGGVRAMPVMHIHSVNDPRAPYHGGLGPPFPFTQTRVMHSSVEAMTDAWVRRDGCLASPDVAALREAGSQTARELVYGGCRDGAHVALWQLSGAGHAWPGGIPARERSAGPATKVIDANTEIWKFFSKFSLPRQ